MTHLVPSRRALLGLLGACAIAAAPLPLQAQETPIKFQLDWRFEGPAAMFLVPVAKGYFKAEKLNVTVDAGRKAWPIFAKANNVSNVTWTAMDPPLRETMLVRGDIDAITGFTFTSLLNLEARGAKTADVVILPYPDYGVKLYGNAVIVGEDFLKKNPAAVKAFLRAFTKGMRDVIADPKAGIATVKARDGIIDTALEERRLKLALDATVLLQGAAGSRSIPAHGCRESCPDARRDRRPGYARAQRAGFSAHPGRRTRSR